MEQNSAEKELPGATTLPAPGRKRRSLAVRADYLKLTKEELRKELRLRGLRTGSKRLEMIRKLERWEQERLGQVEEHRTELQGSDRVEPICADFLSSNSGTGILSRKRLTNGNSIGHGKPNPQAGNCNKSPGDPANFSYSVDSFSAPHGPMNSLQQGDGRKAQSRKQQTNSRPLVSGDSRNDRGDGSSAFGSGFQQNLVELHSERQKLVLWRRPFTVLQYFLLEVLTLLGNLFTRLAAHKVRVLAAVLSLICLSAGFFAEGSHQKYLRPFEKTFIWCAYWLGLGVLSSVGLGTGLHTFILYLGPHIAAVTFAAHKCRTVDFPEPPYPEEIKCPTTDLYDLESLEVPSIWAIMSKVRLEAFMWGAGTALGELPPYFMARAARLSGELDEEDLEVLEEIKALETADRAQLSWIDRIKLFVENLIQKVGFWGILACASIPNPLFDVAGIMCGHFLVPFRTFFGATLIGKAVFKMHFQKLFVIFVCGESHVQMLLDVVRAIPSIGPSVVPVFEEYLQKQTTKLRPRGGSAQDSARSKQPSVPHSEGSLLSTLFEQFVLVMVVYFVVSIVNSMAQNYHKRMSRAARHGKRIGQADADKTL